MSADDVSDFYIHSATVEAFLGTNGLGVDTFSAAVSVLGFADNSRKLVRNSDGEQVISETTFYTYPSWASSFVPNSRVTIDGAVSRVIGVNSNTSGALDLPDNLAVTLT
ncbi:MAG TPA: hypothetical protein VGI56_01035 [Galbitalea sp.]